MTRSLRASIGCTLCQFSAAAPGVEMPDRTFLESYSLYQTFVGKRAYYVRELARPAIRGMCPACDEEHTLEFAGMDRDDTEPLLRRVTRIDYSCASCGGLARAFLLLALDGQVGEDEHVNHYTKVGEYPKRDLSIPRGMARLLGDNASLYRAGLTCESHGYGIGAFAYYRRIVDLIIDELLTDLDELIGAGDEDLREKLAAARKAKEAARKIELAKDTLPAALRPGGVNPLGTLYEHYSVGLHALSDSQCTARAAMLRTTLEYLISQFMEARQQARQFNEAINKLAGGHL